MSFEQTVGMVSAVNAASSFAKGYAQVALLNRRQDRLEEQWKKEMAFKESQAAVAKNAMDRQWAFELEKYQEGAQLRELQVDTQKTANELAHLQLSKAKMRNQQYVGAFGEASNLFSVIDFNDPVKAYKDYYSGTMNILSKYPYVEPDDLTKLFDVFSKSLVAARTKGVVHSTIEDVDNKTGHTIIRTLGKDGSIVGSYKLNKYSPGVTKVLTDADAWIKDARNEVLSEARTGAAVMGALNKGMLMLGDAVDSGDEAKKMEALHTIIADLEARQGERMKEVRGRLDKALAPHITDEKVRTELVNQKMGAVEPIEEVPTLSQDQYTKSFAQAYEEDKAKRPGLTPELWASTIKQSVMENLNGQNKLNALAAIDEMLKNYVPAPITQAPSASQGITRRTVEYGPEGWTMGTRTIKKKSDAERRRDMEISNRPLFTGGTGGSW